MSFQQGIKFAAKQGDDQRVLHRTGLRSAHALVNRATSPKNIAGAKLDQCVGGARKHDNRITQDDKEVLPLLRLIEITSITRCRRSIREDC